MSRKLRVYCVDKPDWEFWIRKVAVDVDLYFGTCEDCDPEQYDLVIPLTIRSLNYMNSNFPQFEGIKFMTSPISVSSLCNNKRRFTEALINMGFGEHSLALPATSDIYPYVLKKSVSCFGVDSFIIENKQHEEQVLSGLNVVDYIKQLYVAGSKEYTTHVLFDGEKVIFHRSFEFLMPEGFYIKGRATENLGIKTVDHNQYLTLFEAILSGLNFRGICCFDYKIEEGKVKIFELNPRYGGSLSNVIDQFIPVFYRHLQESNPEINKLIETRFDKSDCQLSPC